MKTVEHADLHCDVVVSARWELPGQLLVEVTVTGRGVSEHVLGWLAEPEIKVEFLGTQGARVVAARGDQDPAPGVAKDRTLAWVESPAPAEAEMTSAQFHVALSSALPAGRVGRVVVHQRDAHGPSEEVFWALSASFDLVLAGDPGADGGRLEISPASYTLMAGVSEDVDEDGIPGCWAEYSTEVRMVPGAVGGCPHDPCFGEEIYLADPRPALQVVDPR